jgi:uncharacterized membrane protein HdeD (DUF308 family)
MQITKLWPVILGFLLVLWGLLLLGAVSFDNSSDVLGAVALAAGLFLLADMVRQTKEDKGE